jgi:hypothetical protein
LLVPFGGAGYVALRAIVDAAHGMSLAVRHQIEVDCH